MFIKDLNPYNLTYKDIDKKVTRVKILIFNDNDEILICNINGEYTYIGGHVEENETINGALYRELEEETGFVLKSRDIIPFYKIQQWNTDHFNTGKKCLSEIYYYSIFIDEKYNINNLNLDEEEKNKRFFLEYMDIEKFRSLLEYKKNVLNSDLHKEMLDVFNYYNENIYKEHKNEKKLQKRI